MGIKQIIKLESDAVTDRPITIPYEFPNLSSLPDGKTVGNSVVITPITVRTWFRIKPLLLEFAGEDLGKLSLRHGDMPLPDAARLMAHYDSAVLDIVCLAIHNRPSEPPLWFRNVLMDNSTWEDLLVLLNAVLLRLCYNPFINTITLLKVVSPLDEAEIIALQENNRTWTNR